MKKLIGFLTLFSFALPVVAQQVNPNTQIKWPTNCSTPGYVYSYQAQLCVPTSGYSLPIAQPSTLGGVKPDNTTCTVNGSTGVLTCSGSGYTLPIATPSVLGGVKPDGTSCTVNSSTGVLTCSGGTAGTAPVQLATTGSNISLSGEQTIDGVLTSSSRVLVKDQTTQTQNGVYVSGSGAWTRASDFTSPVTGNTVYVTAGSTNFDTVFAVDAPNPITVGSSQLTFRPKGPYNFVYPGAFPCDIVAAGGQTCKAAYSLVRRMFASYSGNLYQVTRASDSTTTNVGTLSSGLVNTATETAFCAGTTCTRSKIYDQTGTSANDQVPYS